MPADTNAPLGVSLVSGFLGSGKTTFVNRLLSAEHGVRMGVLVNDFGDIDIDGRLVVSRSEDTIALANGCICCSLRDDLAAALQRLVERNVEHVVVEASGVADPGVLARTFLLLDQTRRVALDAVVVLVDTEQLASYGADDLALARDQLAQANVVLLNKIDLAGDDTLAFALRQVDRFCPRAAVVRCSFGDAPIELVLGVGRFHPDQLGQGASSAHGFRTASFTCDEPLTLSRLREAATELPASVFRAKGLVYLRERPDEVCVLHVVGRRARIDLGPAWGDRPRRTELVFLGRGDLDADTLQATFAACTQPPSRPTVMRRARAWLRARWPG